MADFLILGFKTEYKGDRGIDMVEIAPRGEALEWCKTWHRVADLKPKPGKDYDMSNPSHAAMLGRWSVVEKAYDAWRTGDAMPDEGVPLAAWSGVTAEQADVLRRMMVRTVEDVAEMNEGATAKLPWPGARRLPQLARDWLNGRESAQGAMEIADLKAQLAEMQAVLADQAKAAAAAAQADKAKAKAA